MRDLWHRIRRGHWPAWSLTNVPYYDACDVCGEFYWHEP